MFKKYFYLVLVFLTLVNFYKLVFQNKKSVDLHHFLTSGKMLDHGYNPYDFLLNNGQIGVHPDTEIFKKLGEKDLYSPTYLTPTLFLFFSPLSKISFEYVNIFWNVLLLISWSFIVIYCLRRYGDLSSSDITQKWWVLLLTFSVINSRGAFFYHFINGQVALISLLFVIFALNDKASDPLKGLFWSIAITFKYHCVVFLLFFILLKRQYRVILFTSGFMFLQILALSFYENPIALISKYYSLVSSLHGVDVEFTRFPVHLVNLKYLFKTMPSYLAILIPCCIYFIYYTFANRNKMNISTEDFLNIIPFTFLPVYHRLYDTVFLIPFILVATIKFFQSNHQILGTVCLLFTCIFSLPLTVVKLSLIWFEKNIFSLGEVFRPAVIETKYFNKIISGFYQKNIQEVYSHEEAFCFYALIILLINLCVMAFSLSQKNRDLLAS